MGDLWLPHRRHASAGIAGTGTSHDRIEDLRSTLFVLEEDPTYRDQPQNPFLHELAFNGFSAELDKKLRSHSDPERQALLAETEWSWRGAALHAACAGGHAEAVKVLLGHGADVHAIDANGCTPLHYAAMLPAAECLATLLDAAQQAVASSDTNEELQKLKHDGPPGNWITHDSESVLLLATYSRSSEVVELLLTRKAVADIDAPDVCGTTALHLSCYVDAAPCCALLVAAGASVFAEDGDGEHACDLTYRDEIQAIVRGGGTLPSENNDATGVRHLDDETLHDEGETIVKDAAPLRTSKQKIEDIELVELPPDRAVLYRARALFKHSRNDAEDDDLDFDVNDIVEVLCDHVPDWEGWSVGRTKGQTGFFPANYCERIIEAPPHPTGPTDTDAVRDAEEVTEDSALKCDGEDAGEMTEKVHRMVDEREKLVREKRDLEKTILHTKEELGIARAEIDQLHKKLREVMREVDESAAKRAKAAEARNAKLKELEGSAQTVTASGDCTTPASKSMAAMHEEILNLQDQVKTLGAQLHQAKLAEHLAQSHSRSMQLSTIREREHWATVENDLRDRLSVAQSASQSRQRHLASVRMELARFKLQEKLDEKRVSETQMAEQSQTKMQLTASYLLMAALRSRCNRAEELYIAEAQQRRTLHNKLQDAAGNIRVYARVRPLLPFETERGDRSIVTTDGRETVRIPDAHGHGLKSFRFSGCFPDTATQEDVFTESNELIQSVFDGYNVCIFAYGQSGSACIHA